MQTADVLWVRNDLRLIDNPALTASSERPTLFLFTADGVDVPRMGAASRVYLHHALQSFQNDLREQYGAQLLIFPTVESALRAVTPVVRVERLLWNRSYDPVLLANDLMVEEQLKAQGIKAGIYRGSVLCEPWDIKNKSGQPFKVFTPFYRAFLARGAPPKPLPKPRQLQIFRHPKLKEGRVDELELLPRAARWDLALMANWDPTESGCWKQWRKFRKGRLADYPQGRDIPAQPGTSRLSPGLHFGQITPVSIWADARQHANAGTEAFLRQVVWREFAISSLYHRPTMDRQPIIAAFEHFPWADEPEQLKAWQLGRTGYPIVDAGMRELWQTGWMHNRVRLIVGSFLVKNLHINWVEGADFFWNTLMDADRANNSMGWQWVAGCGIDPSPYFRIFNPMLQSERFDPDGVYIKRWIPELGRLPKRYIHSPWKAPADIRRLAAEYPEPLVDFAESRQQALMFYDRIKRGSTKAGRSGSTSRGLTSYDSRLI